MTYIVYMSVSTAGGVDPATRSVALFGTVLVCLMTGLTAVSLFSGVNITLRYGWGWIAAWLVTTAALLVSLAIVWHRKRAAITFRLAGGKPEKVAAVAACVFGVGALAAGGVLSGVPILLHHLTSSAGEMTVTVIAKEDDYQQRACRPRLVIEEFTFFLKDFICPDYRAFAEIEVGSRINLKGQVSPFGISASEVVWRTTSLETATTENTDD